MQHNKGNFHPHQQSHPQPHPHHPHHHHHHHQQQQVPIYNTSLADTQQPALGPGDMYSVYIWILQLNHPSTKERALQELSKRREVIPDMGTLIWHSFGTIASLINEIIDVYPHLFHFKPNTNTLTAQQSHRVCAALALLQAVATNPTSRPYFLAAQIPKHLYPILEAKGPASSKSLEYLRLTTLGVIGALAKADDPLAIQYLLETEVIPLCLNMMEHGSELSRTVATFILQRILLDPKGLEYVCQTYERFSCIAIVLGKMIHMMTENLSGRLLKHLIRCYLRLSDNDRAREALRQCLPDQLKNDTFEPYFKEDPTAKAWLFQLHDNLRAYPMPQSGPIPFPGQMNHMYRHPY